MILIESAELKRQKTKFNNDFEKRMSEFKEGVGKKPRRTKFPQQQYACACPTMRTYHDDILSSTCKECIENGTAIPNCPICKCQCQTGIFTEKDIISMGLDKLRKDELKARERVPDLEQRARVNFSSILSSSVKQGFESLSKSNSSLDESNVLSSAAGHLSRQQMPSEEELHSLQQHISLSTKLRGSGADVRQAGRRVGGSARTIWLICPKRAITAMTAMAASSSIASCVPTSHHPRGRPAKRRIPARTSMHALCIKSPASCLPVRQHPSKQRWAFLRI